MFRPQGRSHDAGRDDVDANGSELDGEPARQTLHGRADACPERPTRVRPLPRDAGGEHDRAALAKAAAAILGGTIGAPITQREEATRRINVCSRQAAELQCFVKIR
jgi:hypothetical protein